MQIIWLCLKFMISIWWDCSIQLIQEWSPEIEIDWNKISTRTTANNNIVKSVYIDEIGVEKCQ